MPGMLGFVFSNIRTIWRRPQSPAGNCEGKGGVISRQDIEHTTMRRGRDSNPGYPLKGTTVFETAPFNRSGTPPNNFGHGLILAR